MLLLYRASSKNGNFDDNAEAAREDKFYSVDEIDGRPVQFILLDNNYMDALMLFMENSRFKRSWYTYKDTDGENRTFAEKLEMRLDEPQIQKLIDMDETEYTTSKKLRLSLDLIYDILI